MKKIGDYVVRGQIENQGIEKIQLFDGRFDTGFRVLSFVVYPYNNANNSDVAGILGTEAETLTGTSLPDFSDNTQLAWSNTRVQDNFAAQGPLEIIDPDNMIIEDLYVQVQNAGGGPVNYMIVLEKYDISEWQGALQLVRNSSQG